MWYALGENAPLLSSMGSPGLTDLRFNLRIKYFTYLGPKRAKFGIFIVYCPLFFDFTDLQSGKMSEDVAQGHSTLRGTLCKSVKSKEGGQYISKW